MILSFRRETNFPTSNRATLIELIFKRTRYQKFDQALAKLRASQPDGRETIEALEAFKDLIS